MIVTSTRAGKRTQQRFRVILTRRVRPDEDV
jgi:hypothetical protein